MSMKSRCTCLLFCLSLASISFATASSANESGEGYIKMFDKKLEEAQRANACKERLRRLEPPEPVKLQDPPFLPEGAFPSVVLPINEIVQTGKKLPYRTIVSLPSYQRPAYEEHWHSTVGRWSYMPNRIHYALHRLFTAYDIGLSSWYDFEHNIGLSIPMFQNEKSLDLYIVAFQTEVTQVYTKGNQVVVVGKPKRTGAVAITIKTGDLEPANKAEPLLVQLATTSGDEIDYSLIEFVPPDFWNKQNEQLKKQERKKDA